MSEFLTSNLNEDLRLSRVELHEPPPNAGPFEFKYAFGVAKADRARLLLIVDHLLSTCSALKADRDSAHHGWQATRNSLTAAEAHLDQLISALPSHSVTGNKLNIHNFGDVTVRVNTENTYIHLSHLVNLWNRCSPTKVHALESDKNALTVANAELKRDLEGTTEALKAAEAKLQPLKDTVARLTMENADLRRLRAYADNVEIERLQQENAKLTRELEQTKAALAKAIDRALHQPVVVPQTIKHADLAKYTVEITPEKREKGWGAFVSGHFVELETVTLARTIKLDELMEHVKDLEERMDEIGALANLDQETDEE